MPKKRDPEVPWQLLVATPRPKKRRRLGLGWPLMVVLAVSFALLAIGFVLWR